MATVAILPESDANGERLYRAIASSRLVLPAYGTGALASGTLCDRSY